MFLLPLRPDRNLLPVLSPLGNPTFPVPISPRVMNTKRISAYIAAFVVAAALVFSTGWMLASQTAGQDMNKAGEETKDAAKDTGNGVKKGTTSAYHATKHSATKVA